MRIQGLCKGGRGGAEILPTLRSGVVVEAETLGIGGGSGLRYILPRQVRPTDALDDKRR